MSGDYHSKNWILLRSTLCHNAECAYCAAANDLCAHHKLAGAFGDQDVALGSLARLQMLPSEGRGPRVRGGGDCGPQARWPERESKFGL
jgi:hypothetical protein